jgi:hypothetical protein
MMDEDTIKAELLKQVLEADGPQLRLVKDKIEVIRENSLAKLEPPVYIATIDDI